MALKICVVMFCIYQATSGQLLPRRQGLGLNTLGLGLNTLGRPRFSQDDVLGVNGDEIPGEAGVDYPVLDVVPVTDFTCDDFNVPGYYADQQTGCQVYYRCHKSGRGFGTLCPNGTVFNQETLVCDWWYNFNCDTAPDFYAVNADVVLAMDEVDALNDRLRGTDGNLLRGNRNLLRGNGNVLRGNGNVLRGNSPLGRVDPLDVIATNPLFSAGRRTPVLGGLNDRLRNGLLPTSAIGRLPLSNIRRPSYNPAALRQTAYDQRRSLNDRYSGLPLNDRYSGLPLSDRYSGLPLNNRYSSLPLNNRFLNTPINDRYTTSVSERTAEALRKNRGDVDEFDGYNYDKPVNGNVIDKGYLPPRE